MFKKVLSFFLLFVIFPQSVSAFKADTFVTFSNPVVGYESWTLEKQTPLDLPVYLYQESTPSAVPITWLLRYDALDSATISAYFANLISKDRNQFLGAFLEITPKLVESVGISYPPGTSIHNANRVFLSGYQDFERKIIIDKYMSVFFERFGFYPQSVSAWHLDSYSLQYLQSKYSVLTAMNCDEQYSMDQYRLWGGYVGSPYFPDKNNSLIPARSAKERVNLAMVRWAPRDLYHFYGSGTASMFSFQINDYLGLGLTNDYFKSLIAQYSQHPLKDFNAFTHFNIGLENGYWLPSYKDEIKNVFASIKNANGDYNLHPISLASFGDWLKARYPESSPTYFYKSADPLRSSVEEVSWYQSPWFRLGLVSEKGQTKILDLRVYNRNLYEDYFNTPNQNTSLFQEIPAVIDTVKFPDQSYKLDFDISKSTLKYNKYLDNWNATLVDGNKQIIFDPDQITFVNFTPPVLISKGIRVSVANGKTIWQMQPKTPFKLFFNPFWLIVIIFFFYKFFKSPKPPIFGLFLSLLAGLTLYRSGSLNSFGLGFWGPNGHDALFHLSLISHFRENLLSFTHPQFAGAILQDYHFVFDYLFGLLSKITFTQPLTLYFLVFPILTSLALVSLLNQLLENWGYSRLQKNLAFIFVFLGGSLGFIPRFIAGGNLFSGESAFWANQSVSMFLNPPFVLSLIILLYFLRHCESRSAEAIPALLGLSALGGLLAQTKVYAFILLLGALLLNKKYKLFFGVLAVGTFITLPFMSFSGSPFVFQPLWFTKSLFASFDRVYWAKLVQAWQTYELIGPFYKLFLVNFFALVVFLLGNLGLRVIGLFDRTQPLVKTIIVLGLIIPLIFTQKVNPWNTIQFMYYSIFFLGLFAGKVLAKFLTCHPALACPEYLLRDAGSRWNCMFKWILVIIFLILSIFTSIGTLRDYLTVRSASRVGFGELLALDTLRSQPRGLVLSPVFASNVIATPKPQYAYVSSAYISALAGQPEFLADTINLDITGIKYQERVNEIQKFYNTKDKIWAKKYLLDNNIKYVYETPLERLFLSPADLSLTPLYDSGEIKLYKFTP